MRKITGIAILLALMLSGCTTAQPYLDKAQEVYENTLDKLKSIEIDPESAPEADPAEDRG